jgi:addiction module HigA family antidote
MKTPSHPGRILRSGYLEPLDLSVAEAAEILGVTRQTVHNVISGKTAISAEMAVRLAKAFGTSAELWLRLQTAYDLARVEKSRINVRPLHKAPQRGKRGQPAEELVIV